MSYPAQLIKALSTADVIDVVSDTLIYEGYFKPGATGYGDAVCKIIRRQQTGNVWAKMYADGDEDYDNVWNNRASLSYSHLT